MTSAKCLPPSLPRRQRGAALLMAMAIVTLVTTVAASMVWQQWRAVQVESAERALTQSHWILRGALDWARLILREDARSGGDKVDHLGEPWAVELAEARLSSFLSADKDNTDEGPEAFLSGKVVDVTARYNLRNLLDDATAEVDPVQLAILRRVCEYAALSPALADGIALTLRKALLAKASRTEPEALKKLGGDEALASAPVMPQTVDQLVWLGLDAGTVARLKPYVILLPEKSPININTASREVISAVMAGVDLFSGVSERRSRARPSCATSWAWASTSPAPTSWRCSPAISRFPGACAWKTASSVRVTCFSARAMTTWWSCWRTASRASRLCPPLRARVDVANRV